MGRDYEPDTFTEIDVLRCLESAGLKYKQGGRYITSQCPLHEDRTPSCQIFKDDWFANCLAGCGRFPISRAFPELRGSRSNNTPNPHRVHRSQEKKVKYQKYNLMNWWMGLDRIPRDHEFKTIPLEVLDNLGWRIDPHGDYFIPYFSADKQTIPFAQFRHLTGERRFSMLKNAQPMLYGLWNLDNPKIFLVEGTSDAAVLDYCAVPAIAVPSAASTALVGKLSTFCQKTAQRGSIELIYAGDNDEAGNKLREALDETGCAYRICQPPKHYKDWGDFLVAEGLEKVQDYCFAELIDAVAESYKILDIFPGAKILNIVGSPKTEELSAGEPTGLF